MAVGALQAHAPSIQPLCLLGVLKGAGQVPGLATALLPDGQKPYRHLLLLPIEGLRKEAALSRPQAQDFLGGALEGTARGHRSGQANMGLSIERDDEIPPLLLEGGEEAGTGEAPVGDYDAAEGRGKEGKEVVQELFLDVVLAEEGGGGWG